MGQFSWITQDTEEAIRESVGSDPGYLTTAYLHDNNGNVWKEKEYEGYGVFGGKDFYVLLAEMNAGLLKKHGHKLTGDSDSDRSLGIDLFFGMKGVRYEDITFPNLTRHKEWKWRNEAPKDDPNQGWGEDEDEDEDGYNEDEVDFRFRW